MRITELFIDGFGHFHDKRIKLPEAPVVVIFGLNEAGKSTLLHFFRTILFGFPARNRDLWYPPLSGGNHGGRITLSDDSGGIYTVERFARERKAAASVTDNSSGSVEGESRLAQLLGNVTKEVFESVFAFTLNDLQSDQLLKKENVSSHIYSAGLGATELPKTFKKLEAEKQLIYLPRGSKQNANVIATELDDVEQKIKELTSISDQYSDLKQDLDANLSERDALKKQLTVTQKEISQLDSMRDGWPHWINFKKIEEIMGGLPHHPNIPEDIESKISSLKSRLESAKEEYQSAERHLSDAQIDAQTDQLDTLILDDEKLIQAKSEYKEFTLRADRDKPVLESEIILKKADLTRQLDDLGEGWSRSRLSLVKFGEPVKLKIQSFDQELDESNQKSFALRGTVSTLEKASNRAELVRNDAQKALDDAGTIVIKQEDLNRKKRALDGAFRLIGGYQARKQNIELQEDGSKNRNDNKSYLLYAGFAVIISLLFGMLLFEDTKIRSGFAGIVLLLGLAGIFLIPFFKNRSRKNSYKQDVANTAEIELLQNEKELLDYLAELEIDISNQDYLESMNSQRDSFDRFQEQLDIRRDAERDYAQAKKEFESQKIALRSAKDELEDAQRTFQQILSDWEVWLDANNLPQNLLPRYMESFRVQIETARKTSEELDNIEERLDKINTHLTEYNLELTLLADRHGEQFIQGEMSTLIQALAGLSERVRIQKVLSVEKKQFDKQVEKCEKEFLRRKNEYEDTISEINGLTGSFGTDSIDELERLVEENNEYIRLAKELSVTRGNIETLTGPGDRVNKFMDLLEEQSNLKEIEDKISYKQTFFEEQNDKEEEHIKDAERISVQLESIANENELSDLHLKRNDLTEQLLLQARKWTQYRIAEVLLQKGRDKFQKERQPDVIKHAQEFFKQVTAGRYKTLFAPLGEETVSVTGLNGRSKDPLQLSQGTREQLYLALRFGLIQEYGIRSESLPIIVDEVLVNFDAERSQLAANSFMELSSNNQVLVFTCHEEMVDRFRASKETAQINLD